jgi:cysteinyl-tRNA synthetase
LVPGQVKMYSCGPTVYAPPHIGNYRSFLLADLLRRYLEHKGFQVSQIMNITDIDDKTIRDSDKEGISLKAFTANYERIFFEGVDLLNIERASAYPSARENVTDMIKATEKLVEKGYGYAREGSVYFDVSKFRDYGQLSKLDLGALKAGARVESDEYAKDSPADFALMKKSTPEEVARGITYESPWGNVRPGWHIECSVLSTKYLGESFDIHTGGVDLIFPHHENEIAQSEALTGKKLVNYWLHCQHLLVDGQKMAKSLRNFITLQELLSKVNNPRAIRFILISTHYRRQLDFTMEALKAAENTVENIISFIQRLKDADGKEQETEGLITEIQRRFEAALDDDLDIRGALATLFEFINEVNKRLDEGHVSREDAREFMELLLSFDCVLGLRLKTALEQQSLSGDIEALIHKREVARQRKDWVEADRIRSELENLGITLEDTSKGAKWKVVKKTTH